MQGCLPTLSSLSPVATPCAIAGMSTESAPEGWRSISHARGGVLAVAISATISLALVLATLTYIALTWVRWLQTPSHKRDREASPATRFIHSQFGALFINLLLGDLMQASGFAINFHWYITRAIPDVQNDVCTAQGVLVQAGDLVAAFSAMLIALHMAYIVILSRKVRRAALVATLALLWIGVAVLTFIGPVAIQRGGQPFYAEAGLWCWIHSTYGPYRIWLHYLFVFITAFTLLVTYGTLFGFIFVSSRHTRNSVATHDRDLRRVARIMALYPCIYIASILPLSTLRLMSLTGHTIQPAAQLACGFIFTLAGALDVLVYTTTRGILHVPTGLVSRLSRVIQVQIDTDVSHERSDLAQRRPSLFAGGLPMPRPLSKSWQLESLDELPTLSAEKPEMLHRGSADTSSSKTSDHSHTHPL